jgi:23S rRNA (guanosine2251-2'-O)-methyltransferase
MKFMKTKNQTIIILDNIRSTHNVGSIFRTADALGVSKIYLVGYTPKPIDKFGRPVKEIAKTALGAEKTISWETKKSLPALIRNLKREGFQIIAVEQSPKSVDYKKVRKALRSALVIGNEVSGISKKTLSLCDVVTEIPMRGEKESLNVSVAFGVAGFRLLDR